VGKYDEKLWRETLAGNSQGKLSVETLKENSQRNAKVENIINPLTWRREHQLALIVAAIIGVIIGLAVGYMYHRVQFATSSLWFWSWSSFRWAAIGAIIGAAVVYIRQLVHA
jgi:hypothetical protein